MHRYLNLKSINIIAFLCNRDRRTDRKTDRTGQDRTGQVRTGEDRTGQDRTGQTRKTDRTHRRQTDKQTTQTNNKHKHEQLHA